MQDISTISFAEPTLFDFDSFETVTSVDTVDSDRRFDIGKPLERWCDSLAVFDLETTGIDVDTDRVVTAHVGVIDASGVVLERIDWLADPGVEIPEGASAVHGISTEHARRHGRPSAEVVAEIVAALESVVSRGLPLVIYNAPYDLSLLDREAQRHGLAPFRAEGPIIDPLVIDRAVDRYRKGKRTLIAASAHYGVRLSDAHDAGADAIAAGQLAQAIAGRHADRLPLSAAELHLLQIDWCRDQSASFQDYMRRTHNPEFTATGAWPLR